MAEKKQISKNKKHIITKTKVESVSVKTDKHKTHKSNVDKHNDVKHTLKKLHIKKSKNRTHNIETPPKAEKIKKEMKLIETYKVVADNVGAVVEINTTETEYVPLYVLQRPEMTLATHAILNTIKEELIMVVDLSVKEFVDPSALQTVKEKFIKKAMVLMEKYLPLATDKDKELLAGNLIHEMLGLGDIELILADPFLEEIVINGHKEPLWVYHKHHGWLKTNIQLKTEDQVYNYASAIGRRVGRQITNLDPLMDAHLTTGDRVNATLFPISTQGNTITIRKFSRSPWTIIHFLEAKTLNKEVAALLWLAIQYELNILVAGGTAAGKTSMLNILMPFMPPNQRILSIV
ncbi:MAG: CpaF family protein, partial [Candidatus Aenigmarchaeota archaeon]|nr:CpaF family protein [Candidatus Aenigmarchaeota archaeon]